MVEAVIDSVRQTVEETAGEGFLGLYRFGSGGRTGTRRKQAAPNLIVLVEDDVDLHRLRAGFLPLWQEHRATLRRAPLIVSPAPFRRHLRLFPLFAEHLARHGEVLAGEPAWEPEKSDPANRTELVAYLAHQSLLASAALAPALLTPEAADQAEKRLARLAARLNGSAPAGSPPGVLFSHIQSALRALMRELPGETRAPLVASPGEPNLEAIYRETEHTIFVLPSLSERLLRQIDWERLTERLQGGHASLQVTTVAQLRLLLQSEAALEYVLGRYEHDWGADPLAGLRVPRQAVWRNAARLPSRLLIDEVPGAYLIAPDEEAVHRVIHDYQNRLLNMRLQHELLHRFHDVEAAAPPDPLPGRDDPLPVRVAGILSHLDWWAAYYVRQMENTDASEKLSAP